MVSMDIWISGTLAVVSSISSIVLSIQRAASHTQNVDTKRDINDPFADTHRLTRMTCSTLILTGFAAFDLLHKLHTNQNGLISSACVLVSWVYALALTLLSRKYRLPNTWGWTLNVHLFCIYFVACIMYITLFFMHVVVAHPDMNWLRAVPYIVPTLLAIDLVYVTATVRQGPRFVDEKGRFVCRESVASIWETWLFSWASPIYSLISKMKGDFTDQDLPALTPDYRAGTIFYTFCTRNFGKKSLFRRLCVANRRNLIFQIISAFFASIMYYLPAFLMNRLLQFLQDIADGTVTERIGLHGFFLILAMGVSIVVLGLVSGQLGYYASCALQTQIRVMLNVEVYRKSLRRRDLSTASKEENEEEEGKNEDSSTTGAVVNLMSTDATRVSEFGSLWFFFIGAPVELLTGFFLLYQLIGTSCLLGLLVMVIILPVNHYNTKIFAKTQDRLMEARDKRVSLMNEILQGIRQIKFFAWENKWEERIMDARKVELKQLSITYINSAFFSLVWQGAPILVTLISFYSFTKLQGNQLTAPIAFTAINIFSELRFALNILPESFVQAIQAYSSLKRIEKFLDEEEIQQPNDLFNASATTTDENHNAKHFEIGFNDATLGWSRNDTNSFVLKDLNAVFPRHELSLISGATGSGKTLMLLGLLGEAYVLKGKATCPRVPVADSLFSDLDNRSETIDPADWILEHAMAYVSQTPWLQNASIRDNILFGLPFVADRYRDTLTACALDKDLSIFEDGDLTEIGEKGITLSGGQKARVALARAVYSRAGNIIMDDCLSAVDAHTAKHLYTQCLTGPLMNGRTRILVTHHVKLCLRSCSYLIHIKDGRAEFVGSPSELSQAGLLENAFTEDDDDEEVEEEDQEMIHINEEQEAIEGIDTPDTGSVYQMEDQDQDQDKKMKKVDKKPRVLIDEETRATGSIKFSLYKVYFSLVGNWFYWSIMVLLVVSARGIEIGESWWIKKWAESYQVDTGSGISSGTNTTITYSQPDLFNMGSPYQSTFSQNGQQPILNKDYPSSIQNNDSDNLNFYLGIYCLITLFSVIVGVARYGFIYYGSLRANRQLYEAILKRVLRAPLRFFDTTPVGRILNRFSKDFEAIDSRVPTELIDFVIRWFTIITTVITISFVMPGVFIPLMIVALINIYIGLRYVNSSRELKRLESVNRSPVLSCFTETISGIATIRAYGATQHFLQVMTGYIDANMRPFMLTWLCNRWISVRYMTTSAIVNLCAFAVVLANADHIDVPLAGFGLNFVILFTDNMFWGVRQYTGVEMAFNSVERVVEFTEIDQEAPAITNTRPPSQWPSRGEIHVKDLEVRYAADLDPVIRGISFNIKAQEKVGVIGRTGSGKSTLALSFFRFVEASAGSITIDNVNIHDIGTEDLRSNLTIIPQDPTLFSGTLRSNMDPFDEFCDSDIFLALRRVNLIPSGNDNNDESININVFKNLESPVSEGGKNFSQGQRQLLCMARALLKRTQVVLMDEATASVDFETDKAIQKTIATEFKDSTIICIAHRLLSVIEYDRILVLDHGRIIEYENPLTLLQNTKSTFYQMCQKSGEFDTLLELAKSKHSLVDV